ncbi:PREDICTED: uncharacterized protein LOC104804597 [Tarenaya hassleriana]|uniref:uncharacterized protein LOC104804597 n=1 Tax=Tarenaya hassleriana TaxID=28532 RepID=UPI00053C787D|nr:PREDICTED: uncharacterized protein LOC104804597 [Tarenaya hassleriana]
MPEGNLRSGVYRSFIMCDDPRGVVESGAIRKKKIQWKGKEQRGGTCEEKAEMLKKMSLETHFESSPEPSLQLLRVSRGIQKLNEAIESWSRGLSHEVRPDQVAKDLLRGALDLEESLALLGRFREDSSEDMNPKPRSSGHGTGERNDMRFRRSMSDRFVEQNREKVAERRRIQDGVSSRDCYEELRKVIRESFARQNLLPRTAEGTSSTSRSSQSSNVHGNDSGSTKSSSLSSDIPPSNSVKGPNLIARLMGLDGFPEEHAKRTVHIDKPAIKKPPSEGPEAVRINSVKEISSRSPPPYLLNNCRPEEIPPSTIVLIKPMRDPLPETEGKVKSKMPVVPKKPSMKGEVHPRMISQRKDRATGPTKTSNKTKLPFGLTVKDTDMKKTARKPDEKGANKTKQTTTGNIKTSNAASKALKPVVTDKTVAKKKDNKSNNSSETSTRRRSKLDSNPTGERKQIRARKAGETNRLNAKKNPRKKDNAGKDRSSDNDSISSRETNISVNQASAEEETTSSELHLQGHGHDENSETSTVSKHHEIEIPLKSFLSTSPDFLSYAEGLFDIRASPKSTRNGNSIVISDQRLVLDYAKEVSLQLSRKTCPERHRVSMEELLMEVCNGFEALRGYSNTLSGQNCIGEDSVQKMLEKDLKGTRKAEMVSGVWDLGWRNGFRADDTHRVVIDVEKLILFGLIEEMLS